MADSSRPALAQAGQPDPRRWKALAVCFIGGFVTMLDISIVNVALPSIEGALHAGPTQLQLIVAGYTLAFGLVLVPFGRLGDSYGRRRLYMLAMTGFAVMSLLAGLAQTDTQLSLARLLQGAFAGMSNPQVAGLIQQMFSGKERARAFGLFGGMIGVSTALGPLIGGAILGLAGPTTGWRWIFFINVPLCLAVVPLARRLLPAPPPRGATMRLDLVGLVLLGLGTASFMAPFVTTPDTGFFHHPTRWLWVIPAFLLAPVTYWWERRYQRRHQAAVLNPELLSDRSFLFGVAIGATYFAGFSAIMLVLSMTLQSGLGYTALATGTVQLAFAVASGASSLLAGRLLPVVGRRIVVGGLAVYFAGMWGLVAAIHFVPLGGIAWAIAGALLVMGLGGGSVIAPNQALSFQDVPPKFGSVAAAVLQVGQRSGGAVGTAIVLAVFLSLFVSQAATLGSVEAARGAATVAIAIASTSIAAAVVIAWVDLRRRVR